MSNTALLPLVFIQSGFRRDWNGQPTGDMETIYSLGDTAIRVTVTTRKVEKQPILFSSLRLTRKTDFGFECSIFGGTSFTLIKSECKRASKGIVETQHKRAEQECAAAYEAGKFNEKSPV